MTTYLPSRAPSDEEKEIFLKLKALHLKLYRENLNDDEEGEYRRLIKTWLDLGGVFKGPFAGNVKLVK